MIRFRCPGCRRLIALENARAGQVGRCGECGQKFRVPDETPPFEDSPGAVLTQTIAKTKPLTDQPTSPQPEVVRGPRESAAPRPPRQDDRRRRRETDEEERPKPRRPFDHDDHESGGRRSKRNDRPDRDEASVDEDEELESGSAAVIKARKNKKKHQGREYAGISALLVPILVGGGFWALLGVTGLFLKAAMWILMIAGAIAALAGRAMFAAVVRQDSTGQRLACMFIPFYSAFYMVTHLGRTLVPFLVGFYGVVLVITGGILWVYHDVREQAAVAGDQPGIAREAAGPKLPPSKLILNMGGKEENFHPDGLSPLSGPNRFVIQGDMITIWGSLPGNFTGKWDQLVGQPLPVQPGSNGDDSEIQRPGGGVIKITGGTVTIEKAESIGGKWFLRGRLELKFGGADAEAALAGKFELPVYSEGDEED